MAIIIFSVILSFFYMRLCYICIKLEDRIMGLEVQIRYIKSDVKAMQNDSNCGADMRGDIK